MDAGAISYIDTTASDVLSEPIDELAALDVSLALARVKAPLHERLRASGVEQARRGKALRQRPRRRRRPSQSSSRPPANEPNIRC